VKQSRDENKGHGNDQHDNEDNKSPGMTGSDVTHSRYCRTACVTRICAHVINAAAVAVSLNSRHYSTTWKLKSIHYSEKNNTKGGKETVSRMFCFKTGTKLAA